MNYIAEVFWTVGVVGAVFCIGTAISIFLGEVRKDAHEQRRKARLTSPHPAVVSSQPVAHFTVVPRPRPFDWEQDA